MECQFKPFDRVLVRDCDDGVWNAGEYSHFDGENHMVMGQGWSQCIPYEGNEHLVGTDKNPEELETFAFGDHVVVRDWDNQIWEPAVFLRMTSFSSPQEDGQKQGYRCITPKDPGVWKQCRKADW